MIKFKKQEKAISGKIRVQGDKKISYFAIILSSLAIGKSTISGVLESTDILNLIDILKKFGVLITKNDNNVLVIEGKGIQGLKEPINIIDINNSQDILHLLIGLLSSYNFKIFFKGNDNLSTLNLSNVFNIFKTLSVDFNGREKEYLPFLMTGTSNKKQLNYEIFDYDSMMKDILLISSLSVDKINTIKEKEKSENHLELLMKHYNIIFEEHDIGNKGSLTTKIGKEILLKGNQVFSGKDISIPSDISFSSFIAGLAILIPDSDITLKNILMNQHRDAFYRTLVDMGANIIFINQRIECGEKIADINIKYGNLKNTIIPGNRIYKMMYEYPVLIFIASLTNSVIELQGIKIIKANDLTNYKYIISIIKDLGVNFVEDGDSLNIKGNITNFNKKLILNNDKISPHVKLTLAMFGLFMNENIEIENEIENDFPNLAKLLLSIGLNIES